MNSVPTPSTPKNIAWLLPAGTLFFSAGILLGRSASTWVFAAAALVLACIAALLSRRRLRFFAVMMATLTLGHVLGWRAYHPALPPEGIYAVRATISQEVHGETGGQVQTVLSDVTLDGQPAPDAYWTFYLDEDEAAPDWLVPGTQVALTARVYHPRGQDNPGGFDFKAYLLQRGVRLGLYGDDELTQADGGFSLAGAIAGVRHDLSLRLMSVMGEEAGAYAAAMLLGARDFIPADERAAFQDLGIAHILSVSGYHVGVLMALVLLLTRPVKISRLARTLTEAAVLLAYCLLTGGSAPVIRAAGLILWRECTRLLHRRVLPTHLLSFTALLQLLFNPTLATSPSFQLTYGAMMGLLLVYPRLRRAVRCRRAFTQRLWEAFAATLAAQVGILGPQLYWFGELPLFSLLLNMAVMALANGLMTLYWLTLAVLWLPGAGDVLGFVSSLATKPLLAGVRALASLELTTLWTRQPDLFQLTGWALLVWGLSACMPRKWRNARRIVPLAGAAMLATVLLPLPQRTTTYTQFSVGSADAALLQDREVTVVIDAGEDGQALASHLHRQHQGIEVLILTHLHIDHAGGLRALLDEGIPVENCYLPADAQTPVIDEEVLPLLDELAQTGTVFRTLARGDVLPLPSGELRVLWPEAGRVFPQHEANDACLVMQADVAGVTMLLTGDLSGAYAKYAALPSDILKVAHHGSKADTPADFLAEAAPQLLLLSNDSEAREAHMAALAGDIPLYTTERHGGIVIRFHGEGRFSVAPTVQ